MLEKIVFCIFLVILSFMAGWYAAWHPEAFFSWSKGVGTYWQKTIDHDCKAPDGYICVKASPHE